MTPDSFRPWWAAPATPACDKRVGHAVRAYADEVHDGQIDSVTVAELRAIIAIVEAVG